jgi:hypothetical protein
MTPFDLWRRRLGIVFVGGSLLLVVLGLTVLATRLSGLVFILYWLACAVLAVLALGTALLDLIIVNARAREERKVLAHEAAERIRTALQREPPQP